MNIEFLMPYSFDLHIGDVYNKAIANAPEDSWLVLMDQDTLRPPGFAERVKAVIETHGNKETLFGCMTNRVGWNHPAIIPEMFMEDSITVHLEVAKAVWRTHGTNITPTEVVPGYCMVFHKDLAKTWPPFEPRTITFDRVASRHSKCVLMQGVYIIHLYRWGHAEPTKKTRHLHEIGILKD